MTIFREILPAPVAYVQLPNAGSEPIDLPGCRIHFWVYFDGHPYILVEHGDLDMIEQAGSIPTVYPEWILEPPHLDWKRK